LSLPSRSLFLIISPEKRPMMKATRGKRPFTPLLGRRNDDRPPSVGSGGAAQCPAPYSSLQTTRRQLSDWSSCAVGADALPAPATPETAAGGSGGLPPECWRHCGDRSGSGGKTPAALQSALYSFGPRGGVVGTESPVSPVGSVVRSIRGIFYFAVVINDYARSSFDTSGDVRAG
jgi:hypothetical protein